MSSYFKPNILAFLSDTATIAEGSVVKCGATRTNIALAAAATDAIIGIAQVACANVGDPVEVAVPGGGAKGLAGGTITAGDFLTSDSSGKLVTTTSANDHVIAQAMESAVVGDLLAVHVVSFNY